MICLPLIEISECGVGEEGASVEQLEEEAIEIKVSTSAAGSGGVEKSKGEEAIKKASCGSNKEGQRWWYIYEDIEG